MTFSRIVARLRTTGAAAILLTLSTVPFSSVQVGEMAGHASVSVSELPGGKNMLAPLAVAPDPTANRSKAASEVCIGTMRDSAHVSLVGSGHMVAITEMRDEATLDVSNLWQNADDQDAPKATIVIGEANGTTGLPRKSGNIYGPFGA